MAKIIIYHDAKDGGEQKEKEKGETRTIDCYVITPNEKGFFSLEDVFREDD